MLGTLAVGRTEIHGLLDGEDVLMTAAPCAPRRRPNAVPTAAIGEGRGIGGLAEPAEVLIS
jgi:3-phosphoshikimate 1-carboxyvinyltransferase